MLTKFIILILVLYRSGECFKKKCTDCVSVQDCPEANALRHNSNPEIVKKFKESTCDWKSINRKLTRQVCCSDFGDLEVIHNNLALLPEECGEKYEDRIFGGGFAGLYEYPWMALLYYKKKRRGNTYTFIPKLHCGGTIINSRYILTAAHCINHNKQLSVRVGDYDILRECDFNESFTICEHYNKDYVVEKIIVHEHYNKKMLSNDIALLRVGEPFDFQHDNVAPICLPVRDNLWRIPLHGKNATVAGWGVTNTGKKSIRLQHVVVPIWTEIRCRNNLIINKGLFTSYMTYDLNEPMKILCAGEQGKDSCRGDSGGPLMLQEEYNNYLRMILFGVVSNGPTKCGTGDPGKYTDVTKYIEWILDNIEA